MNFPTASSDGPQHCHTPLRIMAALDQYFKRACPSVRVNLTARVLAGAASWNVSEEKMERYFAYKPGSAVSSIFFSLK